MVVCQAVACALSQAPTAASTAVASAPVSTRHSVVFDGNIVFEGNSVESTTCSLRTSHD